MATKLKQLVQRISRLRIGECSNCGQRSSGDYCQWCNFPLRAKLPKLVKPKESKERPKDSVLTRFWPSIVNVALLIVALWSLHVLIQGHRSTIQLMSQSIELQRGLLIHAGVAETYELLDRLDSELNRLDTEIGKETDAVKIQKAKAVREEANNLRVSGKYKLYVDENAGEAKDDFRKALGLIYTVLKPLPPAPPPALPVTLPWVWLIVGMMVLLVIMTLIVVARTL